MTAKIPSWLADNLKTDIVPVSMSYTQVELVHARKNATMAYEASLTGHVYPLRALLGYGSP